MAYKRRILIVNEASFLATGFSNYGNDLLKRLYKTGKYEIAELGTYVQPGDPRISTIPWKFYPGMPSQNDQEGWAEYNKTHNQWGRQANLGQFGSWCIDKVLLDFQPDIVCGWMDPWMSTVVADTPLRRLFKWIYMPCIDSTPQRYEWLSMYESADYLLGYSDFAINVMNEQSARIKTAGFKKLYPTPARPGVDMSTFKKMDKAAIREKWHLSKDIPIILSCMRNQARKLFCELIDSFAKYKKDNADDPVAQKATLLLHSSGYDAGQEYWLHIIRLSKDNWMPYYYHRLHEHILHTFMCDACGSRHIDYAVKLANATFNNGRAYIPCVVCGKVACRTPNTSLGYSREDLAEIFNLADLYVQVAIAGADEMPATEAKACGVPVLASAYAALEEKTTKIKDKNPDGSPYTMHLGGTPIKIAHYFTEAATMQTRAYFDRADLAKKLKLLSNKTELERLSKEAIQCVHNNCDSDKTAKIWEYILDNLELKDRSTTWDKPLNQDILRDINTKVATMPTNLSDEQFVDWCYTVILGKGIDGVGRVHWINDLKAGRPRNEVISYFINVATSDSKSDQLLMNYRNHQLEVMRINSLMQNPNILKGILC